MLNEALEALFGAQSVGIAVFDKDQRCVRINDVLAAVGQRPAREHIGRHASEFLPELAGKIAPVLLRVVQNAKPETTELAGKDVCARVDYLPVLDDAGQTIGAAMVVVDIHELRTTQATLATRLHITELISELSASFIDLPSSQIDQAIAGTLSSLGQGLDIDRAFIGRVSDDGGSLIFTHQWAAPGLPHGFRLHEPYPLTMFAWGLPDAEQGRPIIISGPDDMPAAAKSMLSQFGVHSAVVLPLRVGRENIGTVGFSRVRPRSGWSNEALACLRLAAEIFASAFDRRRADEALTERLRFDRLLAELSTRFINAPTDAFDAAITDALASIAQALSFDRTVVEFVDEAGRFLQAYEWRASGVASFDTAKTHMPAGQFGWPISEIMAGKTVLISAEKIPPDAELARQVFARSGAKVIAAVPLFTEGQVIGNVNFHRTKGHSRVPDDLTARLQLIAEMLASAIARKRAEDDRRKAFQELSQLKAILEQERDYLREEIRADQKFGDIMGTSPALMRALEVVDAVASTTATVLIRGESGVGKELFARAIHARSKRATGPLVKVNCASIPKELFESEFFGHVRGSFTGAVRDRVGRFQLAHTGTIFLDEVGEIPLELQAKLLRVLQESEFEKVGDDRTRRVDVRIIAATNRDLEADVAAGLFRADLYYRLSVFPIDVPALRDRKEDIPLLAEHYVKTYAQAAGRRHLTLSEDQKAELMAYPWPGNIRELQHVIERAVILSAKPPFVIDLPAVAAPPAEEKEAPAPTMPFKAAELRDLERDNLLRALEKTKWRIAGEGGAAELLGVRPSTLRDRIKALGIQRPGV
jgi:transcriptional regulator with GAF, ATPase, and Fis domain